MEELQANELPEATEYIQWPPDNWQRKYWNLFDGFRAQDTQMKEDLIRQGLKDGSIHYCAKSPGYHNDSWWLCHYHEVGEFFSECHQRNNGETLGWRYFQSEAAARRYGMKFTHKEPPKEIC